MLMSMNKALQLIEQRNGNNQEIQISGTQIENQFQTQSMQDMDRFDVHQIYANKDIAEQNKHGSDFIFIFSTSKRGDRHFLSIQKSHIIWIIVKVVVMSLVSYYLYNWINGFTHLSEFLKSMYLWGVISLPFLMLLVMIIDPGYVLSHQIYENEYEKTNDKKRPKQGKYCQFCRIFIKRKTSHCFRCNHCVARFDHHCGVLTKCVGGTNFLLFYGFVLLGNGLYVASIAFVFYEFVLA